MNGMSLPITELTDRMRSIFGLVVEAYLERGQPVGSKILAGSMNLSSASIRSVLAELRIDPDTVLVIRAGELLTRHDRVGDADKVEVRPVISGGTG